MTKNLHINEEKCIHCGQCVNDCIAKCLKMNDNNIPTWTETGEDRCIKCQHCFAICPTGALTILNKQPEISEGIRNNVNADDLLNLIKSRRSVRHYRNENLDKETLEKLKTMLNYVPTGVNNHGLMFSFIEDKDVMEAFRQKITEKLSELMKKPFMAPVKKKFSRYLDAILKGEDVILRGAPHMVVVSSPLNAPCKDIDPTIALSYFELYAQSLGVSTLWCGLCQTCLILFPELCENFQIPENYKASYVMLFGKSDTKYTRTIQPEPYKMITVEKIEEKNLSLIAKIKNILKNKP